MIEGSLNKDTNPEIDVWIKGLELLSTETSSVQCKRHDASYLAMSYVCNLFTMRLEDVETSQVGIYRMQYCKSTFHS